MSATISISSSSSVEFVETGSLSSSSSVEFVETGLSTSAATKLKPKPLKCEPDVTLAAPTSTPITAGTSILRKLAPDIDEAPKYDSAKYEKYIYQDFKRHRVFVGIEPFMKSVLHVPEDWEREWGPTIELIKRNPKFVAAHLEYDNRCKARGGREDEFYKPLVDMGNAILDFTDSPSSDQCVKPTIRQRYLRNDPRGVLGGVMNSLSPDLVAVHREFLSHISPQERESNCLSTSNLTWAQPLQVLEVKPWGNALTDGSGMPRLKVNGQDPRIGHAYPVTQSRHAKKPASSDADGAGGAASAPEPCPPQKRRVDEAPELSRKISKVHYKSTPGAASVQVAEGGLGKTETHETEHQKAASLQVGRYLLEQFSVPAFRSHATIGLVDRDRIQFYHANHSVILVSSAINFSVGHQGVNKFIAIVIAFSKLSLRDNGILHDLPLCPKLFQDNEKLPKSNLVRGTMRVQEGNKLVFGGDEKTKQFTLTYGETISHEPSLAGRGTAVLHATSPKWKGVGLVAKISWPGSDRVAENKFLAKAVETANSTTANNWARNHLPQVLFAQDVVFDSDSTHGKLASLFNDNDEFDGEEYKYEQRTLRVIIQERLHPVKTLTKAKDVAQVLLDAGCVHRWLYVVAGILHRDLSLNNIMYRIVKKKNKAGVMEEKLYGVLTDFDLASWTKTLNKDYTKTSQQRTGTPPFMAYGLLKGSDPLHLYRHDLESLFYIMLILATHYEIQLPTEGEQGGLRTRQGLEELPYQMWFDQRSYRALASFKQTFFQELVDLDIPPSFEDFRGWLEEIRLSFRRGIRSQGIYAEEEAARRRRRDNGLKDEGAPMFDDETLGGHVNYSALINPARELKGKLKGLIIRYDPSPPTSTSPADTIFVF